MMKLMNKMILSCKDATFYASVKKFKAMSTLRKLQLKIHLLICADCYKFNQQSELIDEGLATLYENLPNDLEETLSAHKKTELEQVVNKHLS